MFKLPFFTWHNILFAAVVSAVGAAFGVRRGTARRVFLCVLVIVNTQKYALCAATPCAFGASSMFRWNVSVEKKFGLLLRCANLHLRCAAPSILRTALSFSLAPIAPLFFVLVLQQMAALNFGNSFGVKLFVQIYRKVTSNIKFKKYKIVNKRSTNNLCTFNFSNC